MRKWIVTISVALLFATAGFYVHLWLPKLVPLVRKNTEFLQGLSSALQILLWGGAGFIFLIRPWRSHKREPTGVSVTSGVPRQLRTPPANFTGRAQELAELLEAVKHGGVTISGLQGLGGIGKTALALKLAENLTADYPDGQIDIDLKGVSSNPLMPSEIMAYVIRSYQPTMTLPEDVGEIGGRYRSLLNQKRVLLLLDNARDDKQIEPVIPPKGCLLLVTSRQHFALPGLMNKNLDSLPTQDAIALVLRTAPRLAMENKADIEQLVHLCGYLPLALRAVASALHEKKNISTREYSRKLADTGKRLALTEIETSLRQSYDLLSSRLQCRFRFLAVFPSTFDASGASSVWGLEKSITEERLSKLLCYSLVDFDERTKRYVLHDLVRLFADKQLHAEERLEAQTRHAGHYLSILATCDNLCRKRGDAIAEGIALYDTELSNIQAGQAWCVAHMEEIDIAAQWSYEYPNCGVSILELLQNPSERVRWLNESVRATQHLKKTEKSIAQGNLGVALISTGELKRSIEYLTHRLRIAHESGSRSWEAHALGNLAAAFIKTGQYHHAIDYSSQQLRIHRERNDREGEGAALNNLGLAYSGLGNYRKAIECQRSTLEIAQETGNHRMEADAHSHLGLILHDLGKHDQAIESFAQQLQIARQIRSHSVEASALGNLGIAFYSKGKYRRAWEYHQQHLKMALAISDRAGESSALGNLGVTSYCLGNYDEAIEYLRNQLKIACEIGDRFGEGNALFNSALCLERLGQRADAIDRAESALVIFQEIESPLASRVEDQLMEWK